VLDCTEIGRPGGASKELTRSLSRDSSWELGYGERRCWFNEKHQSTKDRSVSKPEPRQTGMAPIPRRPACATVVIGFSNLVLPFPACPPFPVSPFCSPRTSPPLFKNMIRGAYCLCHPRLPARPCSFSISRRLQKYNQGAYSSRLDGARSSLLVRNEAL
jgi:hypothetical protein